MNMINSRLTAMAAVLSIALAGTAVAQPAAGTQAPQTTPSTAGTAKAKSSLSAGDRDFMMKAAQSDVAEIQAGQAAQNKASSDAVKKFAAQMVADHTKTSAQLKGMADSRSVALPTNPSAKDERDMKKMATMSGGDFDRAYMASQVRAHRDAVSLFKKEAKSGKDAELKSFAATTLPALEGHLTMATDLSGNLKGSGKTGK